MSRIRGSGAGGNFGGGGIVDLLMASVEEACPAVEVAGASNVEEPGTAADWLISSVEEVLGSSVKNASGEEAEASVEEACVEEEEALFLLFLVFERSWKVNLLVRFMVGIILSTTCLKKRHYLVGYNLWYIKWLFYLIGCNLSV